MSAHSVPLHGDEPAHLETSRLRVDTLMLVTDFSPMSRRALPAVAVFARVYGSRVLLVHALPEPVRHGMMGAADERLAEQARQSADRKFSAWKRDPALQGLRPQAIYGEGPLEEVVMHLARQLRAGLIVMSTRGAVGLAKVWLGSKAEVTLRESPCPVLVLGPKAKCRSGIHSVLLAAGLGTEDLRPAQFAFSIAEEVQAELTLLHVVRQRGLNPGAHETALRQATQGMRALLPESVSDWCTPHLRVGFGDRAHEILRVAREVRPDLLVIGARPGLRASSHLPWTTVAEILAGAPCPVLAVRAHYA